MPEGGYPSGERIGPAFGPTNVRQAMADAWGSFRDGSAHVWFELALSKQPPGDPTASGEAPVDLQGPRR